MKNALLFLLLYSTVLTVFLIAYFLPIKKALGRVVGNLNFAQRFIILFALFTIVIVVGVFLLLLLLKINVNTNLGQVGDFIGGILNPILSFLALIAIVISISIQEKELSSSVSSLQAQEEIFRSQNFENTIFNILSMHSARRSEHKVFVNSKSVSVYVQMLEIIHEGRTKINEKGGGLRKAHAEGRKLLVESQYLDYLIIFVNQIHVIERVINDGALDDEKRRHYWVLVYSTYDTSEAIVFLNLVALMSGLRKDIRKYLRVSFKDVCYFSQFVSDFYSDKKRIRQPENLDSSSTSSPP